MFREKSKPRSDYPSSYSYTRSAEPPAPACRFLLTFDDGPDTGPTVNSSLVLERLTKNGVQGHVKAIFFVQTRNASGGGCEYGRFLLHREHAEGHVLGLHSGTARGHVSHVRMSQEELRQSLLDGMEDITKITGHQPLFVRPPYWWFNVDTLAQYEMHGLNMLLSDMKAYDGVNWGMHVFRRPNMRSELVKARRQYLNNGIPVVDGCTPVVVTFHDTNAYTAGHLEEYLRILMEEAERLRVPLSDKPFYDSPCDITAAALQRAIHPFQHETYSPHCRHERGVSGV